MKLQTRLDTIQNALDPIVQQLEELAGKIDSDDNTENMNLTAAQTATLANIANDIRGLIFV